MVGKISGGGVTTPAGFKASAANADIKGKGADRNDCSLLMSDSPCVAAGIFTANIVKAAPVLYDMEILESGSAIRAVLVNSGNANACTGKTGVESCRKLAESFAKTMEIKGDNILIASTGVIGVPFPYERLENMRETLYDGLANDSGMEFAEGIMTTDTRPKEGAFCVETKNGRFLIGGCCKGSGMIAPSLATMLAFITTDAIIEKELLERALKECAELSFNRITVDGDMSTNDSVIALANGMSGVIINEDNYGDFKAGLAAIMEKLAKKIVKDGEGASKFVTINVINAATEKDAVLCASKIANSPLVKTMFAGCDPNWGRLMASAGASGAVFNPDDTDIYFNDLHYVKNGIIIDTELEKEAYEIMTSEEYSITLDLHAGSFGTKFYTCDFTADYIKINADYRS